MPDLNVINNITLSVNRPNFGTVVYAKQFDKIGRIVDAQLINGSSVWDPPTNSEIVVMYSKPDGKKGIYDIAESVESYSSTKTYPAGASVRHENSIYSNPNAITEPENWNPDHWTYVQDVTQAVTRLGAGSYRIVLAEQALTAAGNVLVDVCFFFSSKRISTLSFVVNVEPGVGDNDTISTDYFNILGNLIEELLDATVHPPQIDQTSRNWLLWDEESAQYVDSGYSSVGIQGDTGPRGYSVATLTRVNVTPAAPGELNTYRINLDNGESAGTFSVREGQDGTGTGAPGDLTPRPSGTANPGSAVAYSRQDHVHPQRVYQTLTSLLADTSFSEGNIVKTLGKATAGDGGAAYYLVSSTGVADGVTVFAKGNLFIHLILDDSINVAVYGDSLSAVQKCITDNAGYRSIVFPANETYDFSDTLHIPSGAHIDFNGSTIRRATDIHDVMDMTNGSNIVLKNLTVNGQRIADSLSAVNENDRFSGIRITNCSDVLLENVNVHETINAEAPNGGLYLDGCEKVSVINGKFNQNDRTAIYMVDCEFVTIDSCEGANNVGSFTSGFCNNLTIRNAFSDSNGAGGGGNDKYSGISSNGNNILYENCVSINSGASNFNVGHSPNNNDGIRVVECRGSGATLDGLTLTNSNAIVDSCVFSLNGRSNILIQNFDNSSSGGRNNHSNRIIIENTVSQNGNVRLEDYANVSIIACTFGNSSVATENTVSNPVYGYKTTARLYAQNSSFTNGIPQPASAYGPYAVRFPGQSRYDLCQFFGLSGKACTAVTSPATQTFNDCAVGGYSGLV